MQFRSEHETSNAKIADIVNQFQQQVDYMYEFEASTISMIPELEQYEREKKQEKRWDIIKILLTAGISLIVGIIGTIITTKYINKNPAIPPTTIQNPRQGGK